MPTTPEVSVLPTPQDVLGYAEAARVAETEELDTARSLSEAKIELQKAKEHLALVEATATLRLSNEGKLDGRNAELRACQLRVLLSQDADVAPCIERVADLEWQVLVTENDLLQKRIHSRYQRAVYDVALAALRSGNGSGGAGITIVSR